MKQSYVGLDLKLHDPPVCRDGITMGAMADRLRPAEHARDREVDEQIAMGWGTTEGRLIPSNWREVQGPDTEEHRRVVRLGVKRAKVSRERTRMGTKFARKR